MQRLISLLLLVCAASSCSVPSFDFQAPSTEPLNACRDQQLSPGEADVDCGGSCPTACPSGAACMTDTDCASASCSGGTCTENTAETCADAAQNQDETDVDCGGKTGCARCAPGAACISSDDCSKGVCLANVCADPKCTDGTKNQDESDVDCGGTTGCMPCEPGKACRSNDDCNGGACSGSICRVPTCSDGLKNQSESDVDCGGTCGPCANGKSCNTAKDCDLALCTGGKCRSQSCSDGVLNQDETDVDCGGKTDCARCATAQHCLSSSDCNNASCAKSVCQPTSCTDGVKNGSETDVDCGSACTKPCADNKGCALAKDCTSLVCSASAHLCQAPSCTDGVKNGSEPTLDCGATCAKKCALADTCGSPSDCASGTCTNMRCVPAAATGTALPMTAWVASASQNEPSSPPGLAIDGNLSTHWTNGTPQVPDMWFKWDMTKPQAFFSITVTANSNSTDYARNLRLSGSMDGTTYTELRTDIVGQPVLKIVFADAQIARYLKLELLSSTGYLWWRIDDITVAQ